MDTRRVWHGPSLTAYSHLQQNRRASNTFLSPPSTATSTFFLLYSLHHTADAFMATPSSSATSPSPPMAYIPHVSTPSQSTPSPTTELFERDNKKKSVQKLIARAELSSVSLFSSCPEPRRVVDPLSWWRSSRLSSLSLLPRRALIPYSLVSIFYTLYAAERLLTPPIFF